MTRVIRNNHRSIALGARGWRFPLWMFLRPVDFRGWLH